MKHVGDIMKLKGAELPVVDILTGGSPCQDLSVAGKRAGLAGERSGLFMEQIRLIKEMRENDKRTNGRTDATARPRFMVWENVPGAFSSNGGEDFRAVLEETARVVDENADVPRPAESWKPAGAILGDGWSIAWRVHDAQFWGRTIRDLDTGNVLKLGTPQRRRRIALVADFNGGSATEILFEPYSLSGDFEQGQESREGTSEGFGGCTDPASRVIEDWVSAVNSSAIHQQDLIQSDLGIARTLAPGTHASGSHLTKTLVTSGTIVQGVDVYNGSFSGDVAATLTEACGGTNTSGAKVLCVDQGGGKSSCNVSDDCSPTLTTTHGGEPVVMKEQPILLESNQNHATIQMDGISTALPASMGEGGGYVPMVVEKPLFLTGEEVAPTLVSSLSSAVGTTQDMLNIVQALARDGTQVPPAPIANNAIGFTNRGYENGDVAETLRAEPHGALPMVVEKNITNEPYTSSKISYHTSDHNNNSHNVCRSGCVIRRLTPLECTRLQGFPDGWVDIGEWTDSKGKKHKDSDAPKYKALGNSIALPFWAWMAKRMRKQFTEEKVTMASLFDGIGGFPLVYSWAGVKPVWCSEIEEFCIALTKLRFPEEQK